MPLPILTALAQAQCPHQAKVTFAATSRKVKISGGAAFVQDDKATILGCPFTVPSGKPQPCEKGVLASATKVVIEGRAAIVRSPSDIAQSVEKITQGPLAYASVQTKVMAT
jgi:hypothetical protein